MMMNWKNLERNMIDVLSRHLLGETEARSRSLIQDNRCPGRDSNGPTSVIYLWCYTSIPTRPFSVSALHIHAKLRAALYMFSDAGWHTSAPFWNILFLSVSTVTRLTID
jgi:hypothetical protein